MYIFIQDLFDKEKYTVEKCFNKKFVKPNIDIPSKCWFVFVKKSI